MISELVRYLNITCPICKRKQRFEQNSYTKIWHPIPGFCCDVMRNGDTIEWNIILDKLIEVAKRG